MNIQHIPHPMPSSGMSLHGSLFGGVITRPERSRVKSMLGLTLIELMIALVITSLILLALTRVFVSTRVTYQTDEGLARLQENARFAIQFITHDLRMVGYTGCMGEPKDPTKVIGLLNPPALPFDFMTPVQGFDAIGPVAGSPYTLPPIYPPTAISSTNPGLDVNLAPWGAVGGSDVLVLRFQNGDAAPVDRTLTDDNQIAVIRPHNIQANQVVMVSDCSQAVIVQVTGVANAGPVDMLQHGAAGTPGNSCAAWGACPGSARKPRKCAKLGEPSTYYFCEGAQVAQYRTVTYFIGPGGPDLARVPALYRVVFDESGVAQAEELVEGVENMQISYGLDTNRDGFADQYFPASAIPPTQWSSVMTVRIGLLMATSYVSGPSEVGADTTPFYDIGGMAQITVPMDNRRRKVVVETVKIRNRPTS